MPDFCYGAEVFNGTNWRDMDVVFLVAHLPSRDRVRSEFFQFHGTAYTNKNECIDVIETIVPLKLVKIAFGAIRLLFWLPIRRVGTPDLQLQWITPTDSEQESNWQKNE